MSPFVRDLLERAGVAFVEGALAGLVLTSVTDKTAWLAAASAGVTSALSVVKSALAKRVGSPDSASLL